MLGSPLPNRMMFGEVADRVAAAQADDLHEIGAWLEVCIWIPEPYASGIETDIGPFRVGRFGPGPSQRLPDNAT